MRLVSFLDNEKEEEMERDQPKHQILREAAMKDSIAALQELLREDPQILHKTPAPLSDPPLYIASLMGHSDFVKELLSRNPELAGDSKSRGSSPLHAAAAKGYVEIAKDLVRVNPDLCFAWDQDGMTPLHLGAIKGRIGVLTELVRVRPEATRVLTGRGESVVHLCVKYFRSESLKVLVESVGKDDVVEFVNWRDSNGNTVLHAAVSKKQLEIIKYLVTDTGIDLNARNGLGFTALDVLSHSPGDLRDIDIKELLLRAGASRTNETDSITKNQEEIVKNSPLTKSLTSQKSSSKQPVKQHKHTDWLGRKRSALMVVSSLIATVAFQAAISPPGGVWQDDLFFDSAGNPVDNPHKVGMSVLAYIKPDSYGQFMIINTIAFLASLSIILLLVSGLPMKRRRWMWIQMVIMWSAITAQTATYFVALLNTTPKHVEGVLFNITRISVFIWLGLMGLVFVGNVIRMMLWLLRKYGYIKQKETGPQVYAEEDDNDDL